MRIYRQPASSGWKTAVWHALQLHNRIMLQITRKCQTIQIASAYRRNAGASEAAGMRLRTWVQPAKVLHTPSRNKVIHMSAQNSGHLRTVSATVERQRQSRKANLRVVV